MLTAIVVLTSIAQVALSLFVLLRERHNLSNRLFFFIGIATLAWSLTNYLTTVLLGSDNLIYTVRFILFFVVVQNFFFCLFARTFPGSEWLYSRRWLVGYGVFTAITAAVTLSPFVFTSVKIEDGLAITQAGPGILLFIVHATVSIVIAFRALIKKLRLATGAAHNQLLILLFAAFLLWVIVPITNFALTPLLKTTVFISLSPLYTFAFAGIIAYAVVSQRLFDIRTFAVRAGSYILSIGLLSSLYIAPYVLLIIILFDINFTVARVAIGIVTTLVFVLLYAKVRGRFDTITNKIFYRGYYEPQEVINRLSEVLVHSIDITYLKKQSIKVLQEAIKTQQLTYWLASEPQKTSQHAQLLMELFKPKTADNVVIVEQYEKKPDIARHLLDNNVAVVVRLRTNRDELGFLTLGFKESGELYQERDKQLLDIAADEIAISLQNALHFAEIKNFNETLQQRVVEATNKLRRTNEKLKALDETKDDFISMASHQLRTPLTSVKGYLSLVLDGDAGPIKPQQRQLLAQAFTSSQRMVYLISDLLNVSRLRTGKFVIEPSVVNLADLMTDEISQLHDTAAGHSVTISYDKPANFPDLMLDETKIRQVIMNFMDNAIYYTPAGGVIRTELIDMPNTVELRVIDNGIGVPKSEQHHLFTKFYRAGNARKMRPDGTGLGLFMAKKVIAAQGGALLFESKEGSGSTFGFTFAKSKVTPPAEQPSKA